MTHGVPGWWVWPAALWLGLVGLWWAGLRRRSPGAFRSLLGVYPVVPLLVAWLGVQGTTLPPALRAAILTTLLMGLILWATLTAVWLLGTLLRNHSLMDVAYPVAPWLGAVGAWLAGGADGSAHTLALLACLTLWSWRLSGYIGLRYLPHGEEVRYARWRARGGASWWWWSYFQIHLTQGVIVWIWTWPVAFALQAPGSMGLLAWLGLLAWVTGFVFEAGGDWQMHRFRTDPSTKGQVMDRGLWAWCRHPNYFGEAMMWLGYGLFALSHPWGWLGLPSVAMVFWFMNQGSATAMTERHLLKTRPGYADYMARTPAFLPRPPRPQAPAVRGHP